MSRPNKNGYRVMGAIILFALCLTTACDPHGGERQVAVVVTEPVMYDTDDPAIWYNKENPEASLIIGTDKDEDGALYVFDLDGKIVQDKVVRNLKRPNNVDVVDGFVLGSDTIAMAGTGERLTHQLRLFSVPDMKPLDGGGIPVFEGETGAEYRDLMGIAFYKRPSDGQVYAIMGRKNGPTDGTYLWQYALEGNEQGEVSARLVRKFGQFSGVKEIEAIAVDHELGYVYYSDEQVGIRKYHADPDMGNEELAFLVRIASRMTMKGFPFLIQEVVRDMSLFLIKPLELSACSQKKEVQAIHINMMRFMLPTFKLKKAMVLKSIIAILMKISRMVFL